MAKIGHYYNERKNSEFRVFAPERQSISVVLMQSEGPHSEDRQPEERIVPLKPDALGYWHVEMARLPAGTRYMIEIDGKRYPDVASRRQPDGSHAASMVAEPVPAHTPGWKGVAMKDAILYELHLGTFTPEGTLAAAAAKMDYLQRLGITVIELLPIAAFPGHRNWGYDGTYQFALQADYGDYPDLKHFIETAHEHGIAVLLDVVYNHFGPEGNYSAAYAPYTKNAPTPWGAAINLDGEYNYGVREFFLENTRYWLQDVGFDGFRMDAVSLIFDNMPVHILRQFTDVARSIGEAEGRELLMIAEHLRNNKYVTSHPGFYFNAQWNDDINHALFANLTGENTRHYANFGTFEDVVTALAKAFVLDGTRFDKFRRFMTGTDGSDTLATEHVVHIQNHDQIGNRLLGDRMITTYGRAKALLAITAIMATPFVPMLFMGEEYGETAPFLFFEDFGDPAIIEGTRVGRKREYLLFGDTEPADPHAVSTFEASKLRWDSLESPACRSVLDYYRELIAMKRSGELGPRDRASVRVVGDPSTSVIRIDAPQTLTVLNFSDEGRAAEVPGHFERVLCSMPPDDTGRLAPFGAAVYRKPATGLGDGNVTAP